MKLKPQFDEVEQQREIDYEKRMVEKLAEAQHNIFCVWMQRFPDRYFEDYMSMPFQEIPEGRKEHLRCVVRKHLKFVYECRK